MTRRQLGRHARRHPLLAAIAVLLVLMVTYRLLHAVLGLAVVAAVGAAAYYAGRRSRPVVRVSAAPPASARSLAQLNRHLSTRCDALQAKLEAETDRAGRAEESARAARDAAAEHLAATPAPSSWRQA